MINPEYREKTSLNEELPFFTNREYEEIQRMRCNYGKMEHDLFFLYVFITSEGLCNEACEFLEDHFDDSVPFRIHE